jgi:hypothetical protein
VIAAFVGAACARVRLAPGGIEADGELAAEVPPGETDALRAALGDVLYRHVYAGPREPRAAGAPGGADAHVARLRAARAASDAWQDGWTVERLRGDGAVLASRERRRRLFAPGTFTARSAGRALGAGQRIRAFFPCDSLDVDPSFYYALGTAAGDGAGALDRTRFYFAVSAAGAAPLVGYLVAQLERYLIPFRMKVPADPGGYARADACVLYVPREHCALTAFLAAQMPAGVRAGLRAQTPPLTKPLASGVALAEHPPGGESFGLHRCALVASALFDAWCGGERDPARCARAVDGAFAAAGLDPERPYLNAGSVDLYDDLVPLFGSWTSATRC